MTAGAGKTTQLLDDLLAEVAQGKSLRSQLVISFSKATVEEVKARLKKRFPFLSSEEWSLQSHNIRTLHSLCWAGLRGEFTLITREHLQQFATEYSWNLSTKYAKISDADAFLGIPEQSSDDDLWHTVQRARLNRISPDSLSSSPGEREALRKLHRDYEAFKRDNGLIDFTGMVEQALERRILPFDTVEEIYVDEAQDMNALFYEYHLFLYKSLDVPVTWYGDEDQAIYGFLGADPTFFVQMPAYETIFGEISKRLPSSLAEDAHHYIRHNKNRLPKAIKSDKPEQDIYDEWTLEHAITELTRIALPGDTILWLALTNSQLEEVRLALSDRAIPLKSSEEEKAFIRLVELIRSKATFLTLANLKDLTTATLRGRKVVPFKKRWFTEPYAMSNKIQAAESGEVSLPYNKLFLTDRLFTDELRELFEHGDWQALLDPEDRPYARELLNRPTTGYEVELSTFHASKGREADIVIICKDITGRALRWALEDEEGARRLGFVAMTRSKRNNIFYKSKLGKGQDFWKVTSGKNMR